jgi:hypothetical protein
LSEGTRVAFVDELLLSTPRRGDSLGGHRRSSIPVARRWRGCRDRQHSSPGVG